MPDEDKKGFTITDRRMKAEEEKTCDKDQKAESEAPAAGRGTAPGDDFCLFPDLAQYLGPDASRTAP